MKLTLTLVFALSGFFGHYGGRPADAGPTGAWLGVRMTPTPEALAAHLGRAGLMVGNVVRDSPADRAGLQRFDVLVSFDGQAIDTMEALQAAVARVGPGRTSGLIVLRGGKEQTIQIAPAARPDASTITYKYEEAADDATRYFGHTLRPDGFGNWVLQPLGRLRDLPNTGGAAPDATLPAWKSLLDHLRAAPLDALRFDVQLDPNALGGAFLLDADDDAAGQAEITINVSQNGQSIKVQRSAEGKVTVTRVGADGAETTATYDSMEAFRTADPDGYQTYRRFTGLRAKPWVTVLPQMQNLTQQQHQWTEQLRRQAQQQAEQARKLADEARRVGAAPRRIESGPARTQRVFSATSLRVGDDGRVTLEITRDGVRKTYEFDSAADFKQREPELYEQFKGLLDGADGAKRTQMHQAALARAV